MKTVCAWCGSLIRIACHCGAPLLPASQVGATFPADVMVCVNGESVLTYSQRAIDEMQVSHGMCASCLAIPHDKRDAMLAERRAADKSIPAADEIERLDLDSENGTRHERSTRRRPR